MADYEARIERLLPELRPANLSTAIAYVDMPDMIRGFGHVKAANAKKAQARYAELEPLLRSTAVLEAAE